MNEQQRIELGKALLGFLDSRTAESIARGYPETPLGTAHYIYPRLQRRADTEKPASIKEFVHRLAPYYLRNALNHEKRYQVWQQAEEEL